MKDELRSDGSQNSDQQPPVSRREFFGKLGAAAVGAAALGAATPLADPRAVVSAQGDLDPYYLQRALATRQYRVAAAESHFQELSPRFRRPSNGDEDRYPNKIGNYSKGLPHQPNGEVVSSAYAAMIEALRTGAPELFEQIPMGGERKLTNPQAGFAFDLEGYDCFSTVQPPPPRFASREIAAEIAENYWMHYSGTSPLRPTQQTRSQTPRPPT